ncbi:ABC transporter substrate-binding protein [Jiangella asiatica]|uniref:Extracellular solute-binding protein n=1 Tax=Jiangella asiatica TaxID=2530372 RepID=A0A4R5DQF0_9ACTN|nr:extracellular solute-binding protein [Jiangella asiatica]TDE14281.1 extracellular solute-binding protein [Jiangella asiatica]
MRLNRRQFLVSSGLAAAGLGLGACGNDGASRSGDSPGVLKWWDPRQPVADIQREIFAEFAESDGGLQVDYTVYNPAEMGEALQLAKQSGQMPDVFTIFGLDLNPGGLVDEGWFTPIKLDDDVRAGIPEGILLEGINVFDGEVYGLPVNDFRGLNILTWFNRELYEQAGLDPENPPVTYDDIRAATRKIRGLGDDLYGWVAPIKETGRMGQHIEELAQAAGAPTLGGVDLRTGEYQFHSQYHLDALEWWLAMSQDGVLFPASTSLDARQARARWVTGQSAIFFDAQFNMAEVVLNFADFESKVALGPLAVPEPSENVVVSKGPVHAGATHWIAAESEHVDEASALISWFGKKEIQARIVEGMNAVPLFPEVVETADVHPLFKKAVEIIFEHVFLAPNPVVRNPDVAVAQAQMKPIDPDFGSIVAGTLTGDVTDYKAALEKLSSDTTAERDRAIEEARKQGAQVSVDDWAFPDWASGQNYTYS